jgi:predicted short-subunit dehydrogenase-like oxidoreductase (DUF2520 family)
MRVLIFGSGRVGASFAAYLAHLGHEISVISRSDIAADRARVALCVRNADLVAAAIPDDLLSAWAGEWRAELSGKKAIHFSGAVLIDGINSYHPLFSFPTSPLPPAVMSRISIAREKGAPAFGDLFPGAPNPEIEISAADRPYYHALAVLSGNFAAFLWNETAKGFADRFGLPPETILAPYLEGVVDRFRETPLTSMTGPVKRQDRRTVEANLAALERDPGLKRLYLAFLESAWPSWNG